MTRNKLTNAFLLATLAVVLLTSVVYASYRAQLTITNNSTTLSWTMLPVIVPVNNTFLAANDFMTASANDTRVQTLVGSSRPHLVADNRTLIAIPVSVGSQTNLYFVTGESAQPSMDIITGYGGNITVSDSPNLELGANFTVSQTGWIDTTAIAGNLTSKADAVRTYISSSSSITSAINRVDTGNLTTFTEVDTGGFLTVGTTNVTAVNANSVTDAYVYRDDGANFYNSVNFTFELYTQGEPANPYGFGGVALTNTVNDISGLAATDLWVAGNARSATVVWIYLGRGNSIATDFAIVTANTSYYINVGKSTGNDNTYAYIYSNPAMTTLVDTLTIAGVGTGTRYRYVYGFINNNTGVINRNFNGWTKDLDFGEVSVTATGISSAERTIATTMGDNSSLLFTNGAGGFSQYVDLTASVAGINLGNQNTYIIETWINPVFISSAAVFSEGSSVSNTRQVLLWFDASTNNITFNHVDDAGTNSVLSWTLPGANVWYHVVASRDAFNVFNLYVNGVLRDSNLTAVGVTTLDNAYIGRWVRLAGPLYGWNGYIDDVRVYVGRGMGGAEALTNYNAGVGLIAPSDSSNLRAHWALDEGSGTAVADSTGNSNSGTLTGAAWSTGLIRSQLSISVDGTERDGVYGVSVPNNPNNWVFGQGDVTPYSDNISISVGGTRQLWYQPNAIIVGTTLPDRSSDATDNPGTIAWGTNPASVNAVLASMTSSGQPSIGSTIETPSRSLLPEVGSADMDVEPDVSGALLTNPFRPLVTMVSDNTTLTERQVWVYVGFALVLLVTGSLLVMSPRHLLLAGTGAGATITLLSFLTIFPWSAMVIAVILIAGGLVSERGHSL